MLREKKSIAIMQPYFLPYAGYFRLFSNTDLFVIYDCVQFPRRGYVHRNMLIDRSGALRWLTLPLAHCPVNTVIQDLEFASDAVERWPQAISGFPIPDGSEEARKIYGVMRNLEERPVDYIIGLMRECCALLNIPWNVVRSSDLGLPKDLRGQDRILEIAAAVGATRYINAPGGIGLYDRGAFSERGLDLRFLTPYEGPKPSILQRLIDQPIEDLRKEFQASSLAD